MLEVGLTGRPYSDFCKYGYGVGEVIVTVGGFLSVSPYVNVWDSLTENNIIKDMIT